MGAWSLLIAFGLLIAFAGLFTHWSLIVLGALTTRHSRRDRAVKAAAPAPALSRPGQNLITGGVFDSDHTSNGTSLLANGSENSWSTSQRLRMASCAARSAGE